METMPDMRTRLQNAMDYLSYCASDGIELKDITNMPTEDIVEYAEDLMNLADLQASRVD